MEKRELRKWSLSLSVRKAVLSVARSPAWQRKVISTMLVCLLLLKSDLVKVKCWVANAPLTQHVVLEALTDGIWANVATGVTDDANTPNSHHMMPRLEPNLAATSSCSHLCLAAFFAGARPIVGQLAYIQEHQNIVRTTLCAPSILLSKLTFKSKMESSPPLLLPHLVLWVN